MGRKWFFGLIIAAFLFPGQWVGLRELLAGTTTLVSEASDGIQGGDPNAGGSFASGRYVPFDPKASILVVGDTDVAPDIKANGSDGPLDLFFGDPLMVTVELDPGSETDEDADWWVLANTSTAGWYYYHLTGAWFPGVFATAQGALVNLSPYGVLDYSGLAPGSYDFYFGVDTNMNGSIDLGVLHYDSVRVTIVNSTMLGTWDLILDWECDGATESDWIFFSEDGTFLLGGQLTGTWAQIGNEAHFYSFEDFTHYGGIISGDTMNGTMSNDQGRSGCWDASRIVGQ